MLRRPARADPTACSNEEYVNFPLVDGTRPPQSGPLAALVNVLRRCLFQLYNGIQVVYSWRYARMCNVRYTKVFTSFLDIGAGKYTEVTLGQQVAQAARRFGNKKALICGEDCLTFNQLHSESHRYAEWLHKVIGMGGVGCARVAVMMPNSLELLLLLVAGAKVGGCSALVNTNLTLESLARSIQMATDRKTPVLIFGEEYAPQIAAMLSGGWLEKGEDAFTADEVNRIRLICHHRASKSPPTQAPAFECEDMHASLQSFERDPHYQPPLENDHSLDTAAKTVVHIFTSGTTGMPKASKVPHLRFLYTGITFCQLFNVTAEDVIYCSLPFYHSNATVCCFGMNLYCGATLVIRNGRFSASSFFPDCQKHGATCAMYIGEVGRFLTRLPKSPADTNHKVRLLFGNGLRPEVWKELKERFKVPQIGEFYGSSEGPSAMFNIPGLCGACAFNPWPLNVLGPFRILKHDADTGMPYRDPKSGFCVQADWGETGEVISKINQKDKHATFHGYTDKMSSQTKILHDVFEKGDMFFRGGDLLRHDANGCVFFVDRIGDTFRWKGENVATTEVQKVCSGVSGIDAADVYGVSVPKNDGRCGMAAILLAAGADPTKTLQALHEHTTAHLPKYARPIFVRVVTEVEMTGTFKVSKRALQQEGYDPSTVSDVYWRDEVTSSYAPLTLDTYSEICKGNLRL